MTSNQLAAAIRNSRRDEEFRNNPTRVAKYEQQCREYEEFCKKYGYPE